MFLYNNNKSSNRVHSTASDRKVNTQRKKRSKKQKKIGKGNKRTKLKKKNIEFLRSLGFKVKKKN